MSTLYAKIRTRKNDKYRTILSNETSFYASLDELTKNSTPYDPGTLIDEGEWFRLENFSNSEFSIDITSKMFDTISSVDFCAFEMDDFMYVDFLFSIEDTAIFFQKIGKSCLVKKKSILSFGSKFEYKTDYMELPIHEYPDAIYDNKNDILYFQKLSSVTNIFKKMTNLYREATQQETRNFLQQGFIELADEFTAEKVSVPNRKRIALAIDTLEKLGHTEKNKIFSYIKSYCPNLKNGINNKFLIKDDNSLKMLLYGIEQRFYTTLVGDEKRIANSVIPLTQGTQNNG